MFVMSPMEKKIDNSDDQSDDEIGPFHTNKHGFPINDATWNRMWKIASRIYPDAKKDMEEIKNSDNLTDVPVLASPVLSPLMTVGQSLRVVQDFICNLSYNHTGTQLFEIRKTRPLAGLMDTAKEIIKESLPIKCLEAVILAIYLTNSLSSVERFPIGFKSVFNGHRYYHVVLGIYYNGTFGALGLSRREDLMNKALKWKSFHDMICDYQSAYANYSHELKKVRLGGIVSHDMHSHERIHWGISIVNMTKTTDVEQRNIMDQFTKCIRSQYAYSPTPPSKKDASRTSKKFYESLTATKKEHKKENYISKSVSKSPKPKKISSAFDSSYHVKV